jgi:hypothetical protein
LDVFDARLVLSTTLDDTADLANRMTLFGLNQLWAADITYIRLASEFVYLAVVLDVFSREGHWLGSWAKSQIPTSSLRFEASNRESEAAPRSRAPFRSECAICLSGMRGKTPRSSDVAKYEQAIKSL